MMNSIPEKIIDWDILNEIVSMDDDDPGFSKLLIIQFIDQANTTFQQIQDELDNGKNFQEVSGLGHFLKGSSSALGLQRIAWACERIQNYGKKSEYSINKYNENSDDCLRLISESLILAKNEFEAAKKELSNYYKVDF